LRALGAEPQICHLNEGHAVFTSLERMRHLMETQGLSFLEARQATNAGTLFTTHTPVSAGFDLFPSRSSAIISVPRSRPRPQRGAVHAYGPGARGRPA